MNTEIAAAVILGLTYIGVAFTRLPHVNVDRPSAAFLGAVLMVLAGVLTFGEAIEAIDFNTIGLLLGMMMLVAALKVAGFFDLMAVKSMALAGTPLRLLVLVVVATGVASALLVNDTVVLLFTPILIQICRLRKVNPVPYLIAEAMASNIGSTATIVGNPQNTLIGITSGIPYANFTAHLLPVAVISSVLLIGIVRFAYRDAFTARFPTSSDPVEKPRYDPRALQRLIPILIGVTIAFFVSSIFDLKIPGIALVCGAIVLLAGRVKPSTIIREVDWVLLLFFAGLFIVIEGAQKEGLLDHFIHADTFSPDFSGIVLVCVVSVIVSQLVSNVPLTMLLLPTLKAIPGDVLWISLAAGSTLGGNLTIIGAVANIIVVEAAAREGISIGFKEFLKIGVPVTLSTVGVGVLILGAEYWMGWLQ